MAELTAQFIAGDTVSLADGTTGTVGQVVVDQPAYQILFSDDTESRWCIESELTAGPADPNALPDDASAKQRMAAGYNQPPA